ncbi:MAG TPA: DUF3034 family protein [Pseudomonadales bacterium]|nr:DUF3034 family protein [Pseudomonadales bacterium]
MSIPRARGARLRPQLRLLLVLALLAPGAGAAGQGAAGQGSSLAELVPRNARIDVTGGVTGFEGAAGGGLVPWALVAGYGSRGEVGASVFGTRARLDDLDLEVAGFAVAWEDRLELSAARQRLHVEPLDTDIEQDVYGVKLRVLGRAPYTDLPQIAVGAQYKRNRDFDGVPAALGARREDGIDYYVSAGKLFFAAVAGRNLFTNATLRWSRAHETGLMGFGSERRLLVEGSVGLFVTDDLVVGAEYRQKPAGLDGFDESDWMDLFVAWFPVRHLSVTLAHLDFGDVVIFDDQRGWYLSLEASL